MGGDRHYLVWGVDALENGGCCIYGMTRSKETDYKTIPFIMCVDSDGLITSTDEKADSYFDITILGNPGSSELKFVLGEFKNDLSYQVLNIQGQVITKGVGVQGLNTISSQNWAPGMYIIAFIHNGKIQHKEKWIKIDN